jgi:hypothetical protein
VDIFQRDANGTFVAFGDTPGHLSTNPADLPFQLPQTRLLRVLLN